MIKLRGIGFAGRQGSGRIFSNEVEAGSRWRDKADAFSEPFSNYARLDHSSRSLCNAIAHALGDAKVSYGKARMETGILGCNKYGSSVSDWTYYMDYIDNGRKLGRGNYFIYTLPSSPLAEASIHFGLAGPLLYTSSLVAPLVSTLSLARTMCLEAGSMLAGIFDEDAALFFYIVNASGHEDPGIDIGVIINSISALGNSGPEDLIDHIIEWAKTSANNERP